MRVLIGETDSTSEQLVELVARLWCPADDDSWPVSVSLGEAPAGHRIVERYAVVRNADRPQFLVPLGGGRATVAAFTKFHTTSSTRTRILGWAMAGALGSPGSERFIQDRLTVSLDKRVPTGDEGRWLLLSHFAEAAGVPGLLGYIPVRRATPNAKPTIRLFSRDGSPMGYAKVGWSAATRDIVRNESAALNAVAGGRGSVHAPRLLAGGTWQQHEYCVASPLPGWVRAYHDDPSADPSLLMDVASSGSRVTTAGLRGSSYAARVRRDLDAARREHPEEATTLLAWLDRLVQGDPVLAFGRWHGDWVPWNMGMTGRGLVVWDWEYSDPCAPLGFDAVHWYFQQRLAPADATVHDAVAAARAAAPTLPNLSSTAAADLVISLYLIEMFTRATKLASQGAGWNPKLHPGFLGVAERSDRPS